MDIKHWFEHEFNEFLHRKDLKMSQVQLSVTFDVVAQANPLTVTPATETLTLTVGVPVTGTAVAVVSGGVPPYAYAPDPNSGALPTGVTFSEDLNGNITLSGTPTVAGTSTTPVLLDITDSAGASVKAAVKVA